MTDATNLVAAPEAPQVKKVSISEILRLIKEEGKTRKEIRKHFGLTQAQNNKLFQNEKLKGVKAHTSQKTASADLLEIIDDAPEREYKVKKAKKVAVEGDANTTNEAATTEVSATVSTPANEVVESAPVAATPEW